MNDGLFDQVCYWYWPLFYLVAFVLVLVQFRRYSWGKLLAIYLGLSLALTLDYRVVDLLCTWHTLEPEQAITLFRWLTPLNIYSGALMLLAVASLPFGRAAARSGEYVRAVANNPTELRQMTRSPWLTMLWLPLSLNIHWLFWLYRTVRELKQLAPDRIRFSPGDAVGFCFIPVFNLYWIVYLWVVLARVIGRLHERYPDERCDGAFATVGVPFLWTVTFVTNILAGFDVRFLVVGELMLLTVFGYVQWYLNSIARGVVIAQERD